VDLVESTVLDKDWKMCVGYNRPVRRGADKFWLSLFAAQPKEFPLDGLKKLEQRNHKCVELRGEYVE
jgi:hypothetical protein